MINQSTLNFLKELSLDNSREWLEQNKRAYENTKNDILTLTEQLLASIPDIDETFSKLYLDHKKCFTRLNRDLRFSKLKIPYKTDYYICIKQKREK